MLPVLPAKNGGENGTEEREDGAEVGDDLQGRGEQRPEYRPGDAEDPETEEPEEADGEGILKLGDGPVLEGRGGDADVVGGGHGRKQFPQGLKPLL
jgi:hypothetical protein